MSPRRFTVSENENVRRSRSLAIQITYNLSCYIHRRRVTTTTVPAYSPCEPRRFFICTAVVVLFTRQLAVRDASTPLSIHAGLRNYGQRALAR